MDRHDLVTTIEIRDRSGRVIGTKDVATYAGLLSRAHEEGLKRVETKVIQLPTSQNGMTAVAWAQVETTKGIFTATADASPENTTARVGRFLVAFAETRAKARALRDAVNIGVIALEEILGDNGQGFIEAESGQPAESRRGGDQAHPSPASAPTTEETSSKDDLPLPNAMTEAQRRYLFRLLSDQGLRDQAAHDALIEMLGVESLSSVTKEQASAAIDRLREAASATPAGGS